MLDNATTLQRFISVVEIGTLRGAADAIGITQPALTRTLRLLAEDVGGDLFEKRGRNLALTPLGTIVLSQARHLLREHQLAEAEVRALHGGERGNLRIAAASLWSASLLPQILSRLHQEYPSLNFTISAKNYYEAIEGLKNGEYDAFFGGFQKIEALPSFLVRRSLFQSHLAVVARQDHPVFAAGALTATELRRYRWISYQSDVAYLDTLNSAISHPEEGAITASVHCDSILTGLELLRQGDYLALFPVGLLTSIVGQGLRIVPTSYEDISFDSGPIFRRSLRENRAFQTLLDMAEAEVIRFQAAMPKT